MFADLARDVMRLVEAAHEVNDSLIVLRDVEVTDELRAIEGLLGCASNYVDFAEQRIGILIARAGG